MAAAAVLVNLDPFNKIFDIYQDSLFSFSNNVLNLFPVKELYIVCYFLLWSLQNHREKRLIAGETINLSRLRFPYRLISKNADVIRFLWCCRDSHLVEIMLFYMTSQ